MIQLSYNHLSDQNNRDDNQIFKERTEKTGKVTILTEIEDVDSDLKSRTIYLYSLQCSRKRKIPLAIQGLNTSLNSRPKRKCTQNVSYIDLI